MKTPPSSFTPFQLATFQAYFFGLFGILAGILYSFGGLIYDVTLGMGLNYGTLLAFQALIGMPLIFVVTGWVSGFVGGFLFRIISKRFSKI